MGATNPQAAASAGAETPVLVMERITKDFPGVRALDGVTFEVRRGEVHALVGENGAGKSTLVKILAGAVLRDKGEIRVEGRTVEIPSPHAAQELGVAMIYQEFNLVPHLTVAENIFLGREPQVLPGIVDWGRMYREAAAVLDRLGVSLDVREPVSRLSVAQQQMVEIAKAISASAKLIVMDEPSATLTEHELTRLFELIGALRKDGVSIIYISHRLEELREIGDRVTVMRDGQRVHTGDVASTDLQTMIRHMVGRELTDMYPKESVPIGRERLRVEGLTYHGGRVRDVSFSARAGEIVGLAGLVGAGRTELAEALFGVVPVESGSILVDGRPVRLASPHDAIRAGIGFLTEDRKRTGLLLNLPVAHNVTIAALGRLLRGFHLPLGAERRLAEGYVERLRIRTPSVRQIAVRLSGGNQQKVVLAKWLYAQSQILIFDEPTLGIDVGAKVEVYRLLCELARQGAAIVMISSDLPELMAMSDTLLTMRRGQLTAKLDPRAASQEEVLRYMALGADPAFAAREAPPSPLAHPQSGTPR